MGLNAIDRASTYIIQSQDEEIKRIAFELHEGISQNLYSVYTGLEFMQSCVDNPDLKDYAKDLLDVMNRTIQEVRLLSVELYPSTLATLGLVAALKSYLKLYTSTFGIIVETVSKGNEFTIAEEKGMALFRSCQEALINIAKYADTSTAKISFTWDNMCLQLDIEDDGNGFDLEVISNLGNYKGLAAMKQRMIIAGGDCKLSSEKGMGTKVSLTLPIK
jgi:two-component system, NarL family, sensor histidine kinase NreB